MVEELIRKEISVPKSTDQECKLDDVCTDDENDEVEDHFDKTVLPKVMQVKNFGRSGRTKYTHLVDQDTTQFDSPWISETAQNLKFHNNQAAGMKQYFDRPSLKKLKTTNWNE